MKRLLLAIALLLAITPASADELDTFLKNRGQMVAAVAIMLAVPVGCTTDQKKPSPESIVQFVLAFNHKPDDQFMADVKAQIQKVFVDKNFTEGLTEEQKKRMAALTCLLGVDLTKKLRQVTS
jgi:hypothetical protein